MIGENIEIKILGLEQGQVKLGITAPPDVPIYRQEIYQSIKEENLKSIQQTLDTQSLNKKWGEILKEFKKKD